MRAGAFLLASALAVVSCGGPSAPSEVVSSIGLTAPPLLYIGQASGVTAVATHPDGTTHDVTALASWSSSSGSVASVSTSGVVTGIAGGTTTIRASYQGSSATANVQVFPAPFAGPSSLIEFIDGAPFTEPPVLARQPTPGYADVEAVSLSPTIIMHVVVPMARGVYDVTASVSNGNLDLFTADGVWIADGIGHGGAGTITVANVTANRISGTFSGIVNGVQGTTGTKSITNGVFDVIF